MSVIAENMHIKTAGNQYELRLGNGSGWHLIATGETESWVEKLAAIMELKTQVSNGYPKMVFTRREPNQEGHGDPIQRLDPHTLDGIPSDGWKANDSKAIILWLHDEVPDVICEIGNEKDYTLDIIRMWQSLYTIYNQAQESGGLPFHAALIQQAGKGVLLASPGGTGKSTCCRRLPSLWHALCDDETLVVRDGKNKYLAHPFPTWSNYLEQNCKLTWKVERHTHLNAIFFLKQAKADKVVKVGQGQAAILINESASQVLSRSWRNISRKEKRILKEKLFGNACQLARTIPAFTLHVSFSGRFWEEIEKVLR